MLINAKKTLLLLVALVAKTSMVLASTVNLGTYTISEIALQEFDYEGGSGTIYNSTHQLVGAGLVEEPPYNLTAPSFSLSDTSAFSMRLQAPEGQLFTLDFPTGTEFFVGGYLFFATDGYAMDISSELTNLFSNFTYNFVDASISVPAFNPGLSTRVGEEGSYIQWMFGGGPGAMDSFTFSAIEISVDFDNVGFIDEFGELGSLDYYYDTNRPYDNAFNLIGQRQGEAPGAVLSLVPVPEPSQYAAMFGVLALLLVVWRRSRRSN
jgi:hypothetical protein